MTLAIDTAADEGSIALIEADPVDGDRVLEEVLIEAPRGFSHVLFGEIEALLKRHGVSLKEIDLFAAASGPGSFTGVRVGLAAIKGLAEVLKRPAIAVSNLEALAEFGRTNARATIIDAHRGEVYAALYGSEGHQRIPEAVIQMSKFLTLLPEEEIEWITQSAELEAPAAFQGVQAPKAIAAMIAKAAHRHKPGDPVAIEANYVRRSDAELLWKDG